MEKTPIGVPTVSGVGDSLKDFGVGALGGILFLLAYRLFGGLGAIAAPLIAGAMVKGNRGAMIATMAGFMLFVVGGIGGQAGGSDSGDSGVM